MTNGVRNALIVVAIAAAVHFLPGGGRAANLVAGMLSVVLFVGLAWFGARLYRDFRTEIFGLADRNRAMLYGAFAVATLTVAATPRLWGTGPGTLAWFALLGAASFAVVAVYRAWRSH